MKSFKILAIVCLFTQYTWAQNINACKEIVNLTIESISNHSAENLSEYLADDFTIAGQTGEIAKMVLQQLLSQLGETVNSFEETSQDLSDSELELKFLIDYEKKGKREATFIFNEHNLLRELTLFKMEVKTMSNDSKVIKSSADVIEIPFEMAGNLIAVDVILNGVERKFILDSGAPKVILNSNYISRDSSRTTISSSKGVSGNISGMDIEKVESLDFGGIKLIDEEIITIDLEHLENELDYEFYGLIGYELIKDYDIIFDYAKQKITLITAETYEDYKSKNLLDSKLETLSFELQDHIPIIKVKIGDSIMDFGIDCGAEVNLIDDDLFESISKSTRKINSDELIGADNNRTVVKVGEVKRMKIGNKTFKNLSTTFSDISHLNKSYKLKIDGLLGYPLLSKQKTLISFKREELVFIE